MLPLSRDGAALTAIGAQHAAVFPAPCACIRIHKAETCCKHSRTDMSESCTAAPKAHRRGGLLQPRRHCGALQQTTVSIPGRALAAMLALAMAAAAPTALAQPQAPAPAAAPAAAKETCPDGEPPCWVSAGSKRRPKHARSLQVGWKPRSWNGGLIPQLHSVLTTQGFPNPRPLSISVKPPPLPGLDQQPWCLVCAFRLWLSTGRTRFASPSATVTPARAVSRPAVVLACSDWRRAKHAAWNLQTHMPR
eukprot:364282-Chlamydomonas_euryale.AAC.22